MTTWVFHRGALGDSVLLWPRLRVLRRDGPVALVTGGDLGRLAARELGIEAVNIEQPRFNALWRPGVAVEPIAGVDSVLDYVGPESGLWRDNVRAIFPAAEIRAMPQPQGGTELEVFARDNPGCLPPRSGVPDGPIVLHIGAGAEIKRWPLDQWLRLHGLLGGRATLVAGEVETERLSAAERSSFAAADGRLIHDLCELADLIKSASVFTGTDTGPTHLSAQLGVPTIALFGPTDPREWAPVGACVRVLAPPHPCPMDWLDPARVLGIVLTLRP